MMSVMRNVILNQDVLSLVTSMDADSIDCVIADPPYNIGKDFGNMSDKQSLNDYIYWVRPWLYHLQRVLKPSGTGFIYGFDEILAHISVNLTVPHRWLTWYYTNKNTAKATFWQRSHESIIVFWKDECICCYREGLEFHHLLRKKAKGKLRLGITGMLVDSSRGEKFYSIVFSADGARRV